MNVSDAVLFTKEEPARGPGRGQEFGEGVDLSLRARTLY